MENEKIVILKDGEEVECEVLFTFDSPDTNKAYIGYTDHSITDDGRKNIYISSYDPALGNSSLEDITDPKELDMIHDVLLEIERQSK